MSFRTDCERVADETSIDVSFYKDHSGPREFEDDGTLHIIRRGLRASFWISNDDPTVQNDRARRVLDALKITVADESRVLVEEDDDDDICPHCGHEL